ncbi:hypothetical protein RFI_17816 [Reticulomyxa filosa]|uniref:Uncharacterized protein n=1 Tax=Reticulomyxa filosa TaxID=46433 RepID=X6N122_RETFI|nr:hypothetical protein RFI_17816 [Reticulomyxa filosa]|eukprot:ETO19404.1 hypothetical protein RFI_17816 [Reticulomyxa filosa]
MNKRYNINFFYVEVIFKGLLLCNYAIKIGKRREKEMVEEIDEKDKQEMIENLNDCQNKDISSIDIAIDAYIHYHFINDNTRKRAEQAGKSQNEDNKEEKVPIMFFFVFVFDLNYDKQK